AEGPPGIAGHALRHLMSALREKDVQSRMDADGFISIQWLLKAKPVLSSACNGDAKWMATAMGQEEQVRLDKSRRRVRLLSRSEHLLAEAMRIMQDKPFEVVPLRNFFSIPALKEYTNPESVLREALEHADSDLMVQGAFVASRPRAAKLRKSVEQLFENQDPRLQAKMQQTGELPLTWIVSRYADRLGIFAQEDARASEAIAKELAAALRDSEALLVDDRRLSVRKFPQSPERVPEREAQAVPANETQVMEKRAGSSRAATQLRQLLDFYFEPFTLQHNRYLLDLILKRAHAPQDTGPWLAEALHNCSFTFQDLKGLGRIQSALSKLQTSTDWISELGCLKHLRCDSGGGLHLRTQLEVRNFVHAEMVPEENGGVCSEVLDSRQRAASGGAMWHRQCPVLCGR
ncbi:unnamed protein product, partial [Effrenium voratum]